MELESLSKRRWFVHVDKSIKVELKKLIYKESKISLGVKCKTSIDNAFYETSEPLKKELIDEKNAPTFSKLVKQYMEEKSLTSKDIYQNSLIDRKLFSSLNVNDNYTPSKETAIMYCIALNLDLDQSIQLLNSAGYSLYKFSNFDIIVEYFIKNKIYNIDKLNDALYLYTKKCIGYR